jgi:serine/threonine protein kinase
MDLRGKEYKDFGSFLLAKVQFKSLEAMIDAALNICISFRELHNQGYSYQDLNDGNFFINPDNGDVLICDNDNVAPYGVNTGILGKCRYMAPEIVTGKNQPNAQSDRFSLSVILFLLFFNNHPLDGELIAQCPGMTEKHEKLYYGTSPVFIYDPTDATNRPVNRLHQNVIRKWNLFPQYVRDAFIEQFGKGLLHDPQKRQTEMEWITNVILRLRNDLVVCPTCGSENFADIQTGRFVCTECKGIFTPPVINSGKYLVAAGKGKKIHENITSENSEIWTKQTGLIVESKKTAGLFGLKNQTGDVWQLILKNGTTRPVKPGEAAVLLNGNRINFGNGAQIEIKQTNI